MDQATKIRALFEDDKYNSLSVLLNDLNSLLQYKIDKMGSVLSGIVGIEFLDEVKCTMAHEIVPIYFGKTLRDLKCIIKDDTDREHKLFFHYNGPKKLSVTKILIPHSSLENQVFSSIREMILAFKNHLNSLLNYFHQLDKIDRFCTVVEPQEINYKSEFRRILLDDRARLHIEVTSEGLANNVHLVGQFGQLNAKLQAGLLAWDHDKDIVENIMTIFDMVNFPTTAPENVSVSTPAISKLPKKEADAQKKAGGVSKKLEEQQPMTSKESKIENAPICNICLCSDLPDKSEIPKNHCQNPFCGINFHRSCLIQWLMATSEGGSSGCGIISGKCPGCFDIIECDE